jgi:methionyl-tRNA formyltransferase
MEKLKIGYFADGPWSHQAFEKMINDKEIDIMFIVPRSDTTDNTLKNYAKELNIPYLEQARINSEKFYEFAKSFDCDLFVSMSFNQIFRDRIINLPKLKLINCHAGKLPFYRGRNILNWVLINDEKEFGITVHYIDEGIDTGDIILQRTFPINDSDNYNTLLETSYAECALILYDAIKKIQYDNVKVIKQSDIHPVGFYCGKRGPGDEFIKWNNCSRDIFNFIRSICLPGPKATTSISGNIVRINNARMIKQAPIYRNTVGQIVGKTLDGFIVKTSDATVEIFEIETDAKLKIGDRFD